MITSFIIHEIATKGDFFGPRDGVAKFDTQLAMCYAVTMPAKNGRNVALTDEQNAFVERLVKSGRYASASEVVRDGLRRLQDDEQARLLSKWLAEGLTPQEQAMVPAEVLDDFRNGIRAKIQEGIDALNRGDVVDGEKYFAGWRKRLQSLANDSQGAPAPVKRRA